MSDVEQQRSRSAVDLRKKFHKVSMHNLDTTQQSEFRQRSDNSFSKRTRAELPRLPVEFKPRAQSELSLSFCLSQLCKHTQGRQAGIQ